MFNTHHNTNNSPLVIVRNAIQAEWDKTGHRPTYLKIGTLLARELENAGFKFRGNKCTVMQCVLEVIRDRDVLRQIPEQ